MLSLYAAACLLPLVWIGATSLRTSTGVYAAGLSLWVDRPQWGNYIAFWQSADVPRSVGISVALTAASLAAVLLSTSMTAYAIARARFPGRRLLIGALWSTVLLPAEMLVIPTFHVNRALGLIGGWRSVAAVLLVMTAGGQAFNIVLLAAHFRGVTRDLYDAAALDGAGFVRTYWTVAMPMVRPGLVTCGLFIFMGVWNAYLIPLVYLGQQRGHQTLTVALVQFSRRAQTAYHLLAAGQVIAILPVVVVFAAMQRHLVRGLVESARQRGR